MNRAQLEHLIRAAGHALGVDEVIVIGSQAAVLASVPFGLPVEAVRSIEADILPIDDPNEAKADLIDGLLGEASMFQETHGIYAQGGRATHSAAAVGLAGSPRRSAQREHGWSHRLVPRTPRRLRLQAARRAPHGLRVLPRVDPSWDRGRLIVARSPRSL